VGGVTTSGAALSSRATLRERNPFRDCSAVAVRAPVGVSAAADTDVADHAMDSATTNVDASVNERRTSSILEANHRSDTPL
jgi:hypothetical protein